MSIRALIATTFATLLCPAIAVADSLSATGSDQGIGLELSAVERSFDINDSSVRAQGAFGGVHAFVQRGAAFRGEARALVGNLNMESSDLGTDETNSSHLIDARATWGAATAAGTRLYLGVGVEQLSGDEPFGDGEFTSWSAYVPFGVARDAALVRDWRTLVTIEGRFLAAGNEEFDDVPGIGDVDLDREGGAGISLSARFRNETAGIEIAPFLRYEVASDTETKSVGGTDTSIEGIDQATIGVQFSLRL